MTNGTILPLAPETSSLDERVGKLCVRLGQLKALHARHPDGPLHDLLWRSSIAVHAELKHLAWLRKLPMRPWLPLNELECRADILRDRALKIYKRKYRKKRRNRMYNRIIEIRVDGKVWYQQQIAIITWDYSSGVSGDSKLEWLNFGPLVERLPQPLNYQAQVVFQNGL